MRQDRILLVGAGPMAVEYARVCAHLGVSLTVKGRGAKSSSNFFELTGIRTHQTWEQIGPSSDFDAAVICVDEGSLLAVLDEVLEQGFSKVLVEKPGALSIELLKSHAQTLLSIGAEIYVAFNRRHYNVVDRLCSELELDGVASSLGKGAE